ncbi:MAG: metal-dependent hydrolase, partial [Thiotrichaceae bacterium]|nr:metal-dependent hydrolase [Thiotrichaceae bacterium]
GLWTLTPSIQVQILVSQPFLLFKKMANFNTHLFVATTVSGALAIGFVISDLATIKMAVFYWLLGTLGGILPDIDAPISIPSRLLFSSLGIFLATLFVFNQFNTIFWADLVFLWLMISLGVRYGLSKLFALFTIHRGNCHSILAALFFGFLAVVIAHHLLHLSNVLAWFAGIFMMGGYLIHLLLDELYSVDLSNMTLKRSFGTALKIASFRHKFSTILLLLATLGVFQLTPSLNQIIKQLLL